MNRHAYRLRNVNWCHVFPIVGTFMISSSVNMLNMPSRLGMLLRLHDWSGLGQYSFHIPLGLIHLISKRVDSLPLKKPFYIADEIVYSISFNSLTSFCCGDCKKLPIQWTTNFYLSILRYAEKKKYF